MNISLESTGYSAMKGAMTYWMLRFSYVARINLDPKTFEGFVDSGGSYCRIFHIDELQKYLKLHRMSMNADCMVIKSKITMGRVSSATEAQYKAYFPGAPEPTHPTIRRVK